MRLVDDNNLLEEESYKRFMNLTGQSHALLDSLSKNDLMYESPFKGPCAVLSLMNLLLMERNDLKGKQYDSENVQRAVYMSIYVVCTQLDIPVPPMEEKALDNLMIKLLEKGITEGKENLGDNSFDAAVMGGAIACFKFANIPTGQLTDELLEGVVNMVANFNKLLVELTETYLDEQD